MGHLRIGQAKNPGPPGAGKIPWSTERPQDGLKYAEPHRPGFRDFATPGFEAADKGSGEDGDAELFQLLVETANSTSWGPLRKRLRKTRAHVLLAQETKLAEGKLTEASSWALRNGWKLIAAPAIEGRNGGASGGVAIFIRKEFGATLPSGSGHILERGRAVAAIVEPPACRPILLVSVYLRDGAGLGEANMNTLGKASLGVTSMSLLRPWQRQAGLSRWGPGW